MQLLAWGNKKRKENKGKLEMKEQKYYKVVRNVDGEFKSARIRSGVLSLTYKVGEWVEAPLNGILVFDNLGSAYNFLYDQSNIFEDYNRPRNITYEIYEVEGSEPIDNKVFPLFAGLLETVEELVELDSDFFLINLCGRGWPKGTSIFKRVKLLRNVEEGLK